MRLKDQVALVTGGSRGIGRGIVKAFAAEGAKVAFIYKGSQAAADSLVQEVTAAGGTIKAVQCDVTNTEEAQQAVDGIEKEWAPIYVLVNNAGIIRDGLFVRMEPADWDAVINTNLKGTFNFCRAVAFTMARQRKGRIINISSIAADHSNQGQTNYAASKGAINAFTRSLATELAGRGVTVNAIAPGFIETEMTEAVRNKAGDLIKKAIPMKRSGLPEDIAHAAVFLASADAGYITGQVLKVDGGLSLGGLCPCECDMIEYDPYLSQRIVANARRAGIAASMWLLSSMVGPVIAVINRGNQRDADQISGLLSLPFIVVTLWSLIWVAFGVTRQWIFIQELLIRFLARGTDERQGAMEKGPPDVRIR